MHLVPVASLLRFSRSKSSYQEKRDLFHLTEPNFGGVRCLVKGKALAYCWAKCFVENNIRANAQNRGRRFSVKFVLCRLFAVFVYCSGKPTKRILFKFGRFPEPALKKLHLFNSRLRFHSTFKLPTARSYRLGAELELHWLSMQLKLVWPCKG